MSSEVHVRISVLCRYGVKKNLLVDDTEEVISELKLFKQARGGTICDISPFGVRSVLMKLIYHKNFTKSEFSLARHTPQSEGKRVLVTMHTASCSHRMQYLQKTSRITTKNCMAGYMCVHPK